MTTLYRRARSGICIFQMREWTIDQVSVMRDVEYNAGLEDARGHLDSLIQNPDPSKAFQGISEVKAKLGSRP